MIMLKTYFIVFNATHTQITLFLWSASSFDMFGARQDQYQGLIMLYDASIGVVYLSTTLSLLETGNLVACGMVEGYFSFYLFN